MHLTQLLPIFIEQSEVPIDKFKQEALFILSHNRQSEFVVSKILQFLC